MMSALTRTYSNARANAVFSRLELAIWFILLGLREGGCAGREKRLALARGWEV